MTSLSTILLTEWQNIRRLTYDYLEVLRPLDLAKTFDQT